MARSTAFKLATEITSRSADSAASNVSFEDVRPVGGLTFASEAQSVRANWDGNEDDVTWQNSRITGDTVVKVTQEGVPRPHTSVNVSAGQAIILRTTGNVADEEFTAELGSKGT